LKIICIFSLSIPIPVFFMLKDTCGSPNYPVGLLGFNSAVTDTWPEFVNLMALPIRFINTWRILLWSPFTFLGISGEI